MLTVKLAGYNADADIIAKTKKEGWDGLNNISPETISAAYARISRDPRPVTELRADSLIEVDRAIIQWLNTRTLILTYSGFQGLPWNHLRSPGSALIPKNPSVI